MPTLAAGNEPMPAGQLTSHQQGFTLLELLVVLALMALGTAGVALALRSTPQQQLQEESQRLVAWLEAARAQARSQGLVVRAKLQAEGATLAGLAPSPAATPPLRWRYPHTRVIPIELLLGPEPILPAQSLRLQHAQDGQAQVTIGTQGLRPFALQP